MSELAFWGGPKSVTSEPGDLFQWPIVTPDDEQAVLEVLRRGAMSDTGITVQFENEFAAWMGVDYALAYPNGTESLRAAMWACGVGAGDEVLSSSIVIWAGCAQALSLGAAVHFADCDPKTLCIDPADIEYRIGPRTRAIMVVHYGGHPADMGRILPIARRHGIKVIEDVSHAQGALYKGKLCGTLGDVAAMSLMSVKPFAIGEGGMLVTNNRAIHERAVAYGHYERTVGSNIHFQSPGREITDPELKVYAGVPLGTYKHRMHQLSSAVGREQLRHYPERMEEIQSAMNRFWDLLEDTPGVRPIRPPSDSGSTMGGWYFPGGLYRSEELGGLPVERFCEAVRAEGVQECRPGRNTPLHLHPLFHTADLFRQGQPTMISFGQRDVRQGPGSLPVAESVPVSTFGVPSFKRDRPDLIRQYAQAFRKVAEHAGELRLS